MVFLRYFYVFGFLVALALLIQGCGPLETKFRRYGPESIRGFWDQKSGHGHEYTSFAVESLKKDGPELIGTEPSDVDSFCPGYSTLDQNGRIAFWVGLLSAVSEYESGHNEHARYLEKFADSRGSRVLSQGLLQLSVESAQSYGCEVGSHEDLYEPQKNIGCAVRIMNHLVVKSHVISGIDSGSEWRGAARYWSVLRPGHKLVEIRAAVRGLEVCRH